MIAALEGKLAAQAPDHVLINVSGVFYRVFMPGTSIAQLGSVGSTVRVFTHLYVREDQMALYGAPEERQLKMFETLLGITGIGPKVALSILSSMPVDALENAISAGNVDLLTRIPGIGRKTATRLVLELKGKIDIVSAAGITASPSSASEVVEALTGLGYSPPEIQAALSGLPQGVELSTEEIVLHALKRLGR
jgi:Holliday junction DNA helicase RuvA